MPKGSKTQGRLARLAKKDQKRLEGGRIPPLATNMPSNLRDHDGDNKFRLIFSYYDHSICDMIVLSKEDMKRVLNTFSKITKHDQSNIKSLCRPDPIKKAIATGDYAKLFSNLPPDFDLIMEVDYKGPGRIFVYLYQNMCCVVAVAGQHFSN